MSETLLAKSFYPIINGQRTDGIQAMLERVYKATWNVCPLWTRRRIRAIWNEETASIKYREMLELAEAAQKAEQARQSLKFARKEHAQFIAETCRIAALLTAQDADFHSGEIERLRRLAGGMGRTGNQT